MDNKTRKTLVEVEARELQVKLEKLKAFILTREFKDLVTAQRTLLY